MSTIEQAVNDKRELQASIRQLIEEYEKKYTNVIVKGLSIIRYNDIKEIGKTNIAIGAEIIIT